jgi:hypothetical protein
MAPVAGGPETVNVLGLPGEHRHDRDGHSAILVTRSGVRARLADRGNPALNRHVSFLYGTRRREAVTRRRS